MGFTAHQQKKAISRRNRYKENMSSMHKVINVCRIIKMWKVGYVLKYTDQRPSQVQQHKMKSRPASRVNTYKIKYGKNTST